MKTWLATQSDKKQIKCSNIESLLKKWIFDSSICCKAGMYVLEQQLLEVSTYHHQLDQVTFDLRSKRSFLVMRTGLNLPSQNPASIYLLKFHNRNTRTRFEICLKITKTPEGRHGAVLMSLLLTLNIFHTLFQCFYC